MREPGASSGEMPGSPFHGRPGLELDELLDMILNGQPLPLDAPEEVHALVEMLASVPGPPEADRLPGETAARLAFTRTVSRPSVSRGTRPRARRRQSLVSAALVAAAVGLGCAAAGYAGALPGPFRALAYHAIGAPPGRPVRAARQSANGLCNAYEHAVMYGPAAVEATAFQKLEKAAGGARKIDVYCAATEWRSAGPAEAAEPRSSRPESPGRTKPPAKSAPTRTPTPAPAPAPGPPATPTPAPGPDPGPAPMPSVPTVTLSVTPTLTPTRVLTPDAHPPRRP